MRANLKNARTSMRLTQREMADKLGITLSFYQKIEQGERTGGFAIWDNLEDITGIHQRILRRDSLIDSLMNSNGENSS